MPTVRKGNPAMRNRWTARSSVSSGGRLPILSSPLVFLQSTLLHEVERCRRSREHEERHSHQVHQHVRDEEHRPESLTSARVTERSQQEVSAEQECETKRRDEEPEGVEVRSLGAAGVDGSRHQVAETREDGRHTQHEVHRVDRTHVRHEASVADVREVCDGPRGQEDRGRASWIARCASRISAGPAPTSPSERREHEPPPPIAPRRDRRARSPPRRGPRPPPATRERTQTTQGSNRTGAPRESWSSDAFARRARASHRLGQERGEELFVRGHRLLVRNVGMRLTMLHERAYRRPANPGTMS